ncbi:MAG: hypothetical protein ACLTEH_06145, partial [Clostridia bacterium]
KSTIQFHITNLTEAQKDRLRGAIKFFTGDRNNMAIEIVNGQKTDKAGAIYANETIIQEFEELIGKENIQFV